MSTVSVSCRGQRRYQFDPSTTALLVIDLQRDFFAFDSDPCIDEMRAIVPRAVRLIELARASGCCVIYTRETYREDLSDVHGYRRDLGYVGKPGPNGRFLIAGEAGHNFIDEIDPIAGEEIIDKASFGAFYNTPLDDILSANAISHLILCGVTTECCVHSTLREAVDRGYWCVTVADCCAASEPGLHEAALALIAGEGHLFGWVADLSDFEHSLNKVT